MLLHSQIIGEGKPFVILHGFLGMGDNWKTLGKKFSELGYQVHLVDQRNHGRSFHSDVFNYTVLAEDLKKYCDHYSLKSAVLLGHSMGGKTAMEFASKYPEYVSKLIVADIAPKAYPEHHHEILNALSSLDFNIVKSRKQAQDVLGKYILNEGVKQFLLKNLYWKEKGVLGLRINLPVLVETYSEIGKALTKEAKFEKETLFLAGALSNYIDPYDEMDIKSHFPKASIKTVSNAGHWLHAENSKEFYEIVMKFL